VGSCGIGTTEGIIVTFQSDAYVFPRGASNFGRGRGHAQVIDGLHESGSHKPAALNKEMGDVAG